MTPDGARRVVRDPDARDAARDALAQGVAAAAMVPGLRDARRSADAGPRFLRADRQSAGRRRRSIRRGRCDSRPVRSRCGPRPRRRSASTTREVLAASSASTPPSSRGSRRSTSSARCPSTDGRRTAPRYGAPAHVAVAGGPRARGRRRRPRRRRRRVPAGHRGGRAAAPRLSHRLRRDVLVEHRHVDAERHPRRVRAPSSRTADSTSGSSTSVSSGRCCSCR